MSFDEISQIIGDPDHTRYVIPKFALAFDLRFISVQSGSDAVLYSDLRGPFIDAKSSYFLQKTFSFLGNPHWWIFDLNSNLCQPGPVPTQ